MSQRQTVFLFSAQLWTMENTSLTSEAQSLLRVTQPPSHHSCSPPSARQSPGMRHKGQRLSLLMRQRLVNEFRNDHLCTQTPAKEQWGPPNINRSPMLAGRILESKLFEERKPGDLELSKLKALVPLLTSILPKETGAGSLDCSYKSRFSSPWLMQVRSRLLVLPLFLPL